MELLTTVLSAFLFLLSHALGFYLGQRSVRLIGHRRETIQTGPMSVIEKITPEEPPKKGVLSRKAEIPDMSTYAVPTRYQTGGDTE